MLTGNSTFMEEDDFLNGLPANLNRVLTGFIESSKDVFEKDLVSVVLYGSTAEGKTRAVSDVNIVIVLKAFDQDKANAFCEPLRKAQVAVELKAMFLLESEVDSALNAFAVKFADILRRRRILYGEDPFAGATILRAAYIIRLKQTLLNLTLRLRESYISRGTREEQIVRTIEESAGPLRSCAAALLELQHIKVGTPKEALR